jgi:hypothetical protein
MNHEKTKELQPIVMTVPMMSMNVVIAETLGEFFGIGYYNGWAALEQLVYDFDHTIEYYSAPDDSLDVESKRFIEFAQEELNIKFAPLTKERLELLRGRYHPQLIVDSLA